MSSARLVLAIAALASCGTRAHAGGLISLSWDDCGAFGTQNRSFACDSNTGTHVLVGSFVSPAGLDSMNACAGIIDLQSACSTFPDWWSMSSGLCRSGSLGYSFDFTNGPGNCFDYWQGGTVGGTFMEVPSANRSRIRLVCSLQAGDPRIGPVPEGTEVYAFKSLINNAKTVGPDACNGCETSMCIVFNSILITQRPGTLGNIVLSNPTAPFFVAWQSGGYLPPGHLTNPLCYGDCPTPTAARTWGQIKSMYR